MYVEWMGCCSAVRMLFRIPVSHVRGLLRDPDRSCPLRRPQDLGSSPPGGEPILTAWLPLRPEHVERELVTKALSVLLPLPLKNKYQKVYEMFVLGTEWFPKITTYKRDS